MTAVQAGAARPGRVGGPKPTAAMRRATGADAWRPPRWLLGAIGIALFAGLWEVAGRQGWLGPSWPPLSQIWSVLADSSQWGLYRRAASATVGQALVGYGVGVGVALVMAGVGVVVPRLAAPLARFAAVLNAIPVIAIGPVLLVVLRDRGNAPAIFSALAVFFTFFVAASAALRAASPAHHDVLSVLGARGRVRFRRLQWPAALPGLVDGLRLCAPAALLGAVIGEWFGAERGIGVLLVASMQNLSIDRLWAAALIGAFISAASFGLLSLLERAVSARYRPS